MNYPDCFQKTALAALIGIVFVPHSALAELDFAHAPPGMAAAHVAPNVILSLDDSTSMQTLDMFYKGDWEWREHVLRETLLEVFSDKTLLPDGSIRLAWQSLGMAYNLNNKTSSTGKKGNARKWGGCTLVPGTGNDNFRILSSNVTKRYTNSMAILDETHRANFLEYMTYFGSCTNTPTPALTRAADLYMRAPLNKNGPWADIPGEKLSSPENNDKPLGCRRNYHILLTDGDWNTNNGWNTSPVLYSNQVEITLPNGKKLKKDDAQTRIYRSEETRKDSSSIADWALKSWADPLQPSSQLEGHISPTEAFEKAPDREPVKNRITGSEFVFDKFWNPKYDPADWPHMVTFTIGFSDASLPEKNFTKSCYNFNTCAVNIVAPSTDVPYADDGNLADYANGTYTWRVLGNDNWSWKPRSDRKLDMWRGAINGRGKFYAVREAEDLKKAFKDILQTINVEVSGAYASSAASGSNAMRNDIGIFTAEYDPKASWSGKISAKTYNTKTQKFEDAWGKKTTADKLNDLSNKYVRDSRFILTANELRTSDGDFIGREGSLFKWASLGTAEKAVIGSSEETPVVNSGEHIVNYIRGDKEKEGGEADKPFRKRETRQGDIVNSDIWYLAEPSDITHMSRKGYSNFSRTLKDRQPMIYVGGNDGMLHGFSAADGTEKIAYVPHGLLSEIPQLAQPSFDGNHRYFVDGSPFSGDIYHKESTQWKTMLVGTLGAGGKGYFVLDVTNPEDFAEKNAKELVVKDMTLPPGAGDWDEPGEGLLGHIFAKPVMDDDNPQRTVQIAQLNNGRYAAILGNGYGSTSGEAALLIQYLDDDKEMLSIQTPIPVDSRRGKLPPNGLSAPRLVDINGDGRPDVVYAGDLRGNLWKFLINTEHDDEWDVAEWHNTGVSPLFIADRGEGHSANTNNSTLQSIVAAPSVKISDRSKEVTVGGKKEVVPVVGMMVSFGTGRNITTQDPAEQQQQTLYSVLDNTRYALEKKGGKATGRVLVCEDDTPPCDNLVKSEADLPHSVEQSSLALRSISETPKEKDGEQYWDIEVPEPVDFAEHNGWYLDFPLGGERLLKNMSLYDGSNLLMVMSQVPAKGSGGADVPVGVESCEGGPVDGASQYVTLVNIQDGKASTEDLLAGPGSSRMEVPSDDEGALPPMVFGRGGPDDPSCTKDCDVSITPVTGLPNLDGKMKTINLLREEPLRSSWRQMK